VVARAGVALVLVVCAGALALLGAWGRARTGDLVPRHLTGEDRERRSATVRRGGTACYAGAAVMAVVAVLAVV
jgi:hypothetical protein